MGQAAKRLNPDQSAATKFGAELRRWRRWRGLSLAQLARQVHVSADLVGKIEKADRWPTRDLAERWDTILDAGGALTRLWPAVEEERRDQRRISPLVVDPELTSHWIKLLGVLAEADNAVGVQGLASVVAWESELISRHRRAATGSLKDELHRLEGRWLEFASWVADNDGDVSRAAMLLQRAGAIADHVGDVVHGGYVLMRRAQRAAEAHDGAVTVDLAESTARQEQLPARTRALCWVRAAQGYALASDSAAVRSCLAAGYRQLERACDDDPDNDMARHCTPIYVQAHEAYCRLLLGEAAPAINEYRAVLAYWPDGQRLDEGLFRAQLTLALDRAGLLDEADDEGLRALALARLTGSRRTIATLVAVALRRNIASGTGGGNTFLGALRSVVSEGAS